MSPQSAVDKLRSESFQAHNNGVLGSSSRLIQESGAVLRNLGGSSAKILAEIRPSSNSTSDYLRREEPPESDHCADAPAAGLDLSLKL